MNLSGTQFNQLQQALLSAFPSQSALEQLARIDLGVPLNQIAAEKSTTTEIVFALIQWAEAEGRTPELLQAAVKANSGNAALREFAAHFGDLRLGESSTQAGQGESKMMQSQRQRIQDLHRHIERDYDLLRGYEEDLQLTDDRRRRLKIEQEIERQRDAIAKYEAELAGLTADGRGDESVG